MEVVSFKSMVLMVMIMIITIGNMAKSELHYVGGTKSSWAPNVNMTEWSMHEKFYVYDWLYFGYDRHMFNVLQVNKTSYENCIDQDFIKNITRGGGRDVFQLKETKTYYFLSGRGYCWSGMKVAINVEYSAPAPQPVSEHKSSADCYSIGAKQTLVVLALALMWGILFK